MDELVALCKRRGFIFQSNEVYGGLQGVYDFGPLGVELKNNLKNAWWESMVYENDDIEGLDSSILTNPLVLKYSGHESTFSDPMVDCKSCQKRFRADQVPPECKKEDLTEPRQFNLMFKTNVGPIDDGSSFAYLRPETAQQIFTNFKNVVDSTSKQIPFGIAQIGKAFRNEITPRNFIFRVREFEQMELEYFVEPGNDEKALDEWVQKRLNWWRDQGVPIEKIELYNVPTDELAHYSKKTVDLMYMFPHGLEELEGIANRTDFDLASHSKKQEELNITSNVEKNKHSNSKMAVQDKKGDWHKISTDPGPIIVNVGDMLKEASGGYYPSTTHRVVNPSNNVNNDSRYSMPLFLHPRDDVQLSENYTAGSYLKERLLEIGLKN